jgi:hypothetical protein
MDARSAEATLCNEETTFRGMRSDGANSAKAAYQDFLTLWKDADSDIPILKQAKADYAKLH